MKGGQALEDKKQNKGFFDMPLNKILQNIASSILLTLQDLTMLKKLSDINAYKKIILKNNRILYLGIFITILAVFIHLFFG